MTTEPIDVEALATNLENHWRDLIPGILLSPEERNDLDKDLTAAAQALLTLAERERRYREALEHVENRTRGFAHFSWEDQLHSVAAQALEGK